MAASKPSSFKYHLSNLPGARLQEGVCRVESERKKVRAVQPWSLAKTTDRRTIGDQQVAPSANGQPRISLRSRLYQVLGPGT